MVAKKQPRAAPPPLVLVCDDVEDNRLIYAEYLAFKGLRVAQARTGKEAIALTKKLRPSVVIMDVSMPGVDGLAATRAIKADASLSETCIVAVTGHGEPQYRAAAAEAGVDLFVVKPCQPDVLFALIEPHCDPFKRR